MKKCLACMALLFSMSLLFGGGFFVEVSEPSGSSPEGTVAVVQPLGCHEPSAAVFSASAEGISEGRRQSLPLDQVRTEDGALAIRQVWPREGAWVLAVSATYRNQTRSVLLKIDPASGKPMLGNGGSRMLSRSLTEKDISAALRSLE